MDCCIGIDLGGTAVKLGLIGEKGEILDSVQIPTRAESGNADDITDNIAAAVKELASKHKDFLLKAAGIGVPGHAQIDKGIVGDMPNIPVMHEYPLAEKLSKRIGIPVFVDNDANCAGRGEYLFGSAKGMKNFVFVTLGTGVGGGVLINGDLYGGECNYAGEVGHMVLVPGGRQCGCGNFGCWEAYSSASAMIKQAKALVKKGILSSLGKFDIDQIDAKAISDEAKKGDRLAEMIFDEAAKYSGIALGNLINIFNPAACIIGGGVSHAGDYLLDKIKFYTQAYALPKSWEDVDIRLAELGNQAGILGSAALAWMRSK